jgi:hypothetical protein
MAIDPATLGGTEECFPGPIPSCASGTGTSNAGHDNDASLADFLARWSKNLQAYVLPEGFAVIGLTNYGESPVPSTRLAEVLGRSVSEAETLVARHRGWPGMRVENGLITVNPERVPLAPGGSSRSVTAGSA